MIAKVINMPCTVRGFTKMTAEPEGDYPTVVVNARLTREANRQTYRHEIDHLENEDLYKDEDVDKLEAIRHEKSNDNCNDVPDLLPDRGHG